MLRIFGELEVYGCWETGALGAGAIPTYGRRVV